MQKRIESAPERLGWDNCYYLAEEPQREPTPCDGCPYGRYEPCIGFCMLQLLGQIEVEACELAGFETVPAEVRDMSRDEAIILMVEWSIPRKND